MLCLGISLYFSNRFFSIRFGWDENGVFKQGVFKHTHILWTEIRKIYETGAAQEWSEGDMLFMKGKNSGKKVFVVESADKKIVLEFYRPMVEFKKAIAERLNLKIGDNYNAVWNFILNA